MAYSLLRSRRLQVRHLGFERRREEAPSPFDITHNLTVVAKMRILRTLSAGLTLRYASGRPITPIVGAVPVAGKGYYLAVNNLLNRANVLDYEYGIDYTRRRPHTSLFRRSIYFGTTVSLNY